MSKKLCILLIFSKLKVAKFLIDKYRMHNLYAIFLISATLLYNVNLKH